ncbi:hypothetical protein Salat_1873900 [Sesamum alatum]|uniref:Uncharacterized protein n=1 Tax=Sesamum alatum TaxID=300844 RepID=A0AAE2CI12_9LAMI|nr:hypothetical protein Salat_1873900 [Sesamum alatum]
MNRCVTPGSSANSIKRNTGMDNDYFSARFPRQKEVTSAKKGMNIFSPTPSRDDDSSSEIRVANFGHDTSHARCEESTIPKESTPSLFKQNPNANIPNMQLDPTPQPHIYPIPTLTSIPNIPCTPCNQLP